MPRKELGMAGCNSGSCDSMVSTASNHSQRSDNSYDYLSVEEKECLMFLEETIGSLDAEGDSGVSTDDTDYGEPPKPRKGLVPRDVGSRDQRRGAEQSRAQSVSASSSPAPSLPRSTPGNAHAVPAGTAAQEEPREGRLHHGSAGNHRKPLTAQTPDPFQEELQWSRSSGAAGEAAKETKTRTLWGHAEKSGPEEAPQEAEAKRGPPTAPKPRQLPPNIILRAGRSSAAPQHGHGGRAAPAPSGSPQPGPGSDCAAEKGNSAHLDPKEKERARREALEKLGLSQDRREPGAHRHPQPLPAQPGQGSAPGVRPLAFKSNTLERSGVGLGSSMGGSKEQSCRGSSSSSSLGKMSFIERLAPGFLRGRPRPASLAAGKDFAGLREQEEQDRSSKRRSHPLPAFPRPARSAVSVKISPKGAADENRREALKKLGPARGAQEAGAAEGVAAGKGGFSPQIRQPALPGLGHQHPLPSAPCWELRTT
ncbi:PREDICTED: specifically androgen-regulated gene protein [Ficedula albicollis]|uniref:specifically androgen-regulated gene protein n=1 Tax=Ficedula albicollis TaxID=59894 RepID=UPI00035976AC|nr:PREDICTED: specifically androgen-regulated gene protein [Ficedula albicollis]